MLFSEDMIEIKIVPHQKEFKVWKGRLTAEEYATLQQALTDRISGEEICTSSWIPGADWRGTPYQIIYEKACLEDEQHAAFFFGLALWDAVMRHEDDWCFGKYGQNGIQGTTYFKVERTRI